MTAPISMRKTSSSRWSASTTKKNRTNAQKALYADIESVDVVDPHTVKITLKKPNGNFLFNLAWGDAAIVAPEIDRQQRHQPGWHRRLQVQGLGAGRPHRAGKKNPDYWGTPAKLDKVTFKYISDPNAAFAAVMAGDVDAFMPFPAPENLAQFGADPRFKVIARFDRGRDYPVDQQQDAALRQSEGCARRWPMPSTGRPSSTAQCSATAHRSAPTSRRIIRPYIDLTGQSNYDPEKAKALLAEAGFPDGFETTLKLPPPSYARRGGEIIASQLRDVGIQTEISNLEWAQWLEQVFRGKDYGLTIVSHTEAAGYRHLCKADLLLPV